jgi:hypothetical protein
MDASIVTELAALAGAAIGGLTSVFASWLTQHAQAKAQRLAQDKLRRQELYKEFIEKASKCYVDALQHDEADIPALVELYVRVGRMRILSSPKVVESAELVARQIIDTYLAPNKTFLELREMVNSGTIDLLRDFSRIRVASHSILKRAHALCVMAACGAEHFRSSFETRAKSALLGLLRPLMVRRRTGAVSIMRPRCFPHPSRRSTESNRPIS